MDSSRIEADGVLIEVIRKRIKKIYLSVNTITGQVKLSAPTRAAMHTIKAFVAGKAAWIKKHRDTAAASPPAAKLRYEDGELHYFKGAVYPLRVAERAGKAKVAFMDDEPEAGLLFGEARFVLTARKGAGVHEKEAAFHAFYKKYVEDAAPPLFEKWSAVVGKPCLSFCVRKTRSIWGSCNTRTGKILLSLDLAKRDPACLEYVVIHEMTHLLEASHNAVFKAYMDTFLPNWREVQKQLMKPLPPPSAPVGSTK